MSFRRRRIGRYDASDDVLFVDAKGLKLESKEAVDAIFDELDGLARQYPGRYAIVCLEDIEMASQAVAAQYGIRASRWSAMLPGVARYGVADPVVRSYIRTEALKHQKSGMRSNLFETREDALAAIDAMRVEAQKA